MFGEQMSYIPTLTVCVYLCLSCGAERGGQRATILASSGGKAIGAGEPGAADAGDESAPMRAKPLGGQVRASDAADLERERAGHFAPTPEVQPEPVEPRELGADMAGAVLNRLPTWAATWSRLLKGFSPRRCVLAERHQVSVPSSGHSSDDEETTWMQYDVGFAHRHRSLFRASPDDSLWADIYVATFGLGSSEKALLAGVGDTSYLTLVNPKTGRARVVWVFGMSCGFDDALWLDGKRLVAVGSCIEDDKQRPFVAHVDVANLVFERFDYPLASSRRFDTVRYIRQRHPQIRFPQIEP